LAVPWFDVVKQCGEGASIFASDAPPIPREQSSSAPYSFKDQIRHGNTYGEGRVLGQPRHCVCINASRGLSAIAEFLVHLTVLAAAPACSLRLFSLD